MLAEAWRWPLAYQQTLWAGLDPEAGGAWLRERRLQALLWQVLPRSPLYARRLPRGARRRLQDFEPVGKTELMAGFDDWATDRRITRAAAAAWMAASPDLAQPWLGRYLVWQSSGTSGTPALFVQDPASLAAWDALDGLRLRGPGAAALPVWAWGRQFAYVAALGERYAGHVSMARLQALRPWAPQLQLISVLEPLEAIAGALQALNPQVLISYPSCAAALAQRQLQGGLALRLDEIWLGGEQLTAAQRELLRQAFGCPLRNSYGASECFSIAFECAAAGCLHLNADWLILEPVDAQGRAVAEGEFGARCWLTNLANRVQPLLRYELGDRVRYLPGPCACGSRWPRIEVQGRASEALSLPARDRGQSVTLLPLALETLLEQRAGVHEFQLLRHQAELELRLPRALEPAQRQRCLRLVRDWLRELGAAPLRLRLSPQPPQAEAGSGKLLRVLDRRAR